MLTFEVGKVHRNTPECLAGSSAAKADVEIKAMDDWKDRYLEAVNAQIRTEKWKKALRLAEAAFEAERSRQSTLRQVR